MVNTYVKIFLTGMILIAGNMGTAHAGLTLEEHFTNKSVKELRTHTCCWDFVGHDNGYWLRQTKPDVKGNTLAIVDRSFSTCTLETRVRFANPKMPLYPGEEKKKPAYIVPRMGAGIIFGFKDKDNYYIYRLAGEDKVILGKVGPKGWEELKTMEGVRRSNVASAKSVEAISWATLKIKVTGGQVSCYFNSDRKTAPYFVFSYKCREGDCSGRVGLTTFKSVADFEYFKVWE